MSPLSQLKNISLNEYIDEDGNEFGIDLLAPLSPEQIDALRQNCPKQNLPADITELLQYAAGFEFGPLQTISFDALDMFGLEQIFPRSIQLAGDGFGNFWILDLLSDGSWGKVFFACHDPAVIVLYANDLAEFIYYLDEFGKDETSSHLNTIHEQTVFDIWQNNHGFIDANVAHSADHVLKSFAESLPDNFVFADLRNKPLKSGFAWGKHLVQDEKVIRHTSEFIWAFEKRKARTLFAKLFGK